MKEINSSKLIFKKSKFFAHLFSISTRDELKEVLEFMKNKLDYDFLVEMSAIDWLADRGEFEVFYQLLSTSKRKRVRIKCYIKENEAVESVESIYRSADWSEREMFDMFGIKLNNHPYPKRILMPDDWNDYPLRKTYPMEGDESAQWYEVDKIFGKENRDIIGAENRDQAMIDRYDTERFSRLGYEVPYGTDIKTNGETKNPVEESYQEKAGSKLVDKFNNNSSTLEKRR